jgi:hypothetical protein
MNSPVRASNAAEVHPRELLDRVGELPVLGEADLAAQVVELVGTNVGAGLRR